MKRKKKFSIFLVCVLAFILIFSSLFMSYIYFFPVQINNEKLDKLEVLLSMYDKNNKKIETKHDKYVKYEDIPKNLINAFISIEDKRFFEHNGVDYIRILGALKNNLLHKTSQGGSTITQQLAKNMYLSLDKSYDRKIKEIQIALKLEKQYSKEEILEKYLNMLYFGSGEYGVKNASRRFFAKNLNKLTIKECALLAGIIKSPTKYNPINNYENSIKRCNLVLDLMYGQNRISESEYKNAKNEVIIIKNDLTHNNLLSNYSNSVYFEAAKVLGVDMDELPYMDIKICTFLDLEKQKLVSDILNNKNYYNSENENSLALIVDNKTCGVNAYYANFNLNIFDFKRSPGSTIKPIAVFAPALNDFDYHLFTKVENTKLNINGYCPNNYKNYYSNSESIQNCLIHSYNTPACRILNDIGINTSINYLQKLGINCDKNDNNLSLALGGMTNGVNFIDLISAYTTFSNNGMYSKARFINKILDSNNNVIYENKLDSKKVFKKETCDLINIALKDCVKLGTANKMKNLNFDIAAKTGTVSMLDKNYNQDAYNISYTSEITSLFWCGGKKMDNSVSGGGITSAMANDFYMENYLYNTPEPFSVSNNIKSIDLDKYFYNNNEYIICDDISPDFNKINVLIDQTKNNLNKDNSYTNIDLFSPKIIENNESKSLEFTPNPHLFYKIIKRDLFIEKQIDQITNSDKLYSLPLSNNSQYIVIPYYLDDFNNTIIGLPFKYGDSFSILDIDV